MKRSVLIIFVVLLMLSAIFASGCDLARTVPSPINDPSTFSSKQTFPETTSRQNLQTNTTMPSSSDDVNTTSGQTTSSFALSTTSSSQSEISKTTKVTTSTASSRVSTRTTTTATCSPRMKNTTTRATTKQTTKLPTQTKTTNKPTTNKTRTSTTTTPNNVSGEYLRHYENQVLTILNKARVAESLNPLVMNESLRKSAQIRATEIIELFDHRRPDKSPCFSVITIPYRAAGENIAKGQPCPDTVYKAWYNSSGHHKNMFADYFGQIGVACFQYYGRLYWVQLFTN